MSHRLHVLVACHNRKSQTVASVKAMTTAAASANLLPILYLFDDGSVDGTAAAVEALPLEVNVVRGPGDAYWAQSMAQVESLALEVARPDDLLLWLNDDTVLTTDSFAMLVHVARKSEPTVCVGVTCATSCPSEPVATYGGLRRVGLHPLRFRLRGVTQTSEPVDAMNGNIVLMLVSVARQIGGINGAYAHAWADIDYAARAHATGVAVIQAAGVHGRCDRNAAPPRESLRLAYRRYRSRKGAGESESQKMLLRVVSPRAWRFFYAWSSVAFVVRWVLSGVMGSHSRRQIML